VWLLRHYTESYAYQQYRSLQQFFRWLAVEDEISRSDGPAPRAQGVRQAGAVFQQR
jgi:hypothetical protein